MMPHKSLFQSLAASGFKLLEKHGAMNLEAFTNTVRWDEDAAHWAMVNGHDPADIDYIAPQVAEWVLERWKPQPSRSTAVPQLHGLLDG
jgi:hypothetical protein